MSSTTASKPARPISSMISTDGMTENVPSSGGPSSKRLRKLVAPMDGGYAQSMRNDGHVDDSARSHATRTLLILAVAAMAYALAQTTLVPAIPELMRGLH